MISVITINYNNKEGLEKTIESVISQSKPPMEFIVVDGDSTDGSKDVIEQYQDKLSTAISEPDTGIYNAMNKGILAAKGDYLLFLNSGDSFYSASVLKDVAAKIDGAKDFYYGDLWLESLDIPKVLTYPEQLNFSFVYINSLPHPATFIRRSLFKDQLYNEELKLVSDWQFFMKALFYEHATYQHLKLIVSNFDTTGFSNNPEYKGKMEHERHWVMENDFPLLYKDIKSQMIQEDLLRSPGVKGLVESNLSKTGRKVHLKILKMLSLLFKNKTKP
ncbi:MAG: glycosyltransferase family 2 protein [Gilvibacter sp.]